MKLFVAVHDDDDDLVLGMASYQLDGDNTMEIFRMVVAPEARGQGIAKLLGKTLVKRAKELNLREIHLATSSIQVAALRVYSNLGFRQKGYVFHIYWPLYLFGVKVLCLVLDLE